MNLYKDGDGGGGTGLFVEYTSLPSQCGVKTSVATARFRFAIASNQAMAVLSPGFTTFNSGVHLRGAAQVESSSGSFRAVRWREPIDWSKRGPPMKATTST